MARAIFSHELGDSDFQWLLSSYAERNNFTLLVDTPCLPIVLIVCTPEEKAAGFSNMIIPVLPTANPTSSEGVEDK
jgi:hypothetical protein